MILILGLDLRFRLTLKIDPWIRGQICKWRDSSSSHQLCFMVTGLIEFTATLTVDVAHINAAIPGPKESYADFETTIRTLDLINS